MPMVRTALIVVIAGAAAFALLSSIGTLWPHQSMMSQMMPGMMGTAFGATMLVWPVALTASLVVVIAIMSYAFLFPEIKAAPSLPNHTAPTSGGLDAVMRVARPDEREVLDALKMSGGICLQRDIRLKTGLTKLKTHRIVARLAERGILVVRKQGKTNEISLADWLKQYQNGPELVQAKPL